METMSHILESCTIFTIKCSDPASLCRWLCCHMWLQMSQRKDSLIIATNLNRSVQPNGGKGEGVRYGKVMTPSPVDWRMVVASFSVNCNKYIPCSFMLCLNNVKPAAYKPKVYCRHPCAFLHMLLGVSHPSGRVESLCFMRNRVLNFKQPAVCRT